MWLCEFPRGPEATVFSEIFDKKLSFWNERWVLINSRYGVSRFRSREWLESRRKLEGFFGIQKSPWSHFHIGLNMAIWFIYIYICIYIYIERERDINHTYIPYTYNIYIYVYIYIHIHIHMDHESQTTLTHLRIQVEHFPTASCFSPGTLRPAWNSLVLTKNQHTRNVPIML